MVEHPAIRTRILAREKAARIFRDLFPDDEPAGNVDTYSLGQADSGQAHRGLSKLSGVEVPAVASGSGSTGA
ncbi:hypothetical protein ABZ671_31225 [Micromonospora sp. NPDC006766]|uniref:hypothetical protein n=1 Tax=Micromonospora sp. NPDC006766 TaxID=3154778 RepID=UPI0033C9CF85